MKFAPGDRVRLTEEALEQFPRHRDRLGTVVGMSRDPRFARIRLDGHKAATHWAVSFFEAVHETITIPTK
jgi:hypothetical protein